MRLITWLLTNAVALAVASWLIDGIWFSGPTSGRAELEHKIVPLLVVAAILGIVTSFVKPVVKLLSFPVIILTIGIFLLVINALMLMLTGWIAGQVDIGFHVDGFWPALWGSLIITIVTAVIDNLVDDKD
jgi:putative membrane protein